MRSFSSSRFLTSAAAAEPTSKTAINPTRHDLPRWQHSPRVLIASLRILDCLQSMSSLPFLVRMRSIGCGQEELIVVRCMGIIFQIVIRGGSQKVCPRCFWQELSSFLQCPQDQNVVLVLICAYCQFT